MHLHIHIHICVICVTCATCSMPCPMSHAPCPMFHAPCSMPHVPCPVPHVPHPCDWGELRRRMRHEVKMGGVEARGRLLRSPCCSPPPMPPTSVASAPAWAARRFCRLGIVVTPVVCSPSACGHGMNAAAIRQCGVGSCE